MTTLHPSRFRRPAAKRIAAMLLASAPASAGAMSVGAVPGRARLLGPFAGMNRTEAAYAAALDSRRTGCRFPDGTSLVHRWWFEPLGLRLAARTFYHPDFLVQLADGTLEIHEVKGFWEDDARVKIKVAAEMFPFRFVAVRGKYTKRGGWVWTTEEFDR